MPKQKSQAFTRIRAEVIRLVSLIPVGKFTTYGSIAIHMNVVPRHVATVISRLTEEESATLPWQRVVSTNARISQNMPIEIASVQQARLQVEGLSIDAKGYIKNADNHFHVVGVRREIRWTDAD